MKGQKIAEDYGFAPAPLSGWTRSRARRLMDLMLAVAVLPVALPICLLMAAAVRLTSRGPVFFLQKRVGLDGRLFSIVKFRTMVHPSHTRKGSVATIDDQQITAAGRVLRYWKLDELPQVFNVLRGEMSLVGPRPRVPEQQIGRLRCRPGITGAASLAFAREERILAAIPRERIEDYYASRVLPLKQQLDDEYMAGATFFSDLRLLVKTVLTVWSSAGAIDVLSDASREHRSWQALPGEGWD